MKFEVDDIVEDSSGDIGTVVGGVDDARILVKWGSFIEHLNLNSHISYEKPENIYFVRKPTKLERSLR